MRRFLLIAASLMTCAAWAKPAVTVIESANSVTMEHGDATLWTYHHHPVEGKPYFHPLASTDGNSFTDLRPETKVLILTGANNHDWQSTTEVLTQIFETSDQFSVDVELNPERLTAEMLAEYDVLLSNWNTFGKGNQATPWPESFKDAYVLVEAYSSITGEWEPSVFTGQFGEGRCFTILLGHDAAAIRSQSFQQLLLRGTARAAKSLK